MGFETTGIIGWCNDSPANKSIDDKHTGTCIEYFNVIEVVSRVMSSNWLTNWLCNDHWSLLRQLWLISNKDTDKRDNKSIENTSQWTINPSNLCRREDCWWCLLLCYGLAWIRRIFCYIVVSWSLLCVSRNKSLIFEGILIGSYIGEPWL